MYENTLYDLTTSESDRTVLTGTRVPGSRILLTGGTQGLLIFELLRLQKLTQQDDDADQDGYDGSGSQSSCNDSLHVYTVSMVITLADFDPQI